MPNYDYKCMGCGKVFEFFQNINAEPIKECPECNGELKKLIGAGSTPIFKGTGFYQTDYKSKPNKSSDSTKK